MSFAAKLTQVVADKKQAEKERKEIGMIWDAYEALLIEQVTEVFKTRCTRAAEEQKTEVTLSFEVLTREVPDFPRRKVSDGVYYVEQWGESIIGGVTAESWFYANSGIATPYAGAQILFAQMLECLLLKFLAKVQSFGFSSCHREAGTWRLAVSWGAVEHEKTVEKPLKRKRDVSLVGGA